MSKLSTETAEQVIERLGLQPHPYDGWFSPLPQGSTKGEAGIYRLIGVGDFISWHQLPVATMWRHEGWRTADPQPILRWDERHRLLSRSQHHGRRNLGPSGCLANR